MDFLVRFPRQINTSVTVVISWQTLIFSHPELAKCCGATTWTYWLNLEASSTNICLCAGQALQGRRLEELSVAELSHILADVETLVRDLSEELVQDLGIRDELEFEKVIRHRQIDNDTVYHII